MSNVKIAPLIEASDVPMAQDNYWAGDVLLPLPRSFCQRYLVNRFLLDAERSNTENIQDIGRVAASLARTAQYEPIPEGEQIPFPDRLARSLTRVVIDGRQLIHVDYLMHQSSTAPYSRQRRLYQQGLSAPNVASFMAQADAMLDGDVAAQSFASAFVRQEDMVAYCTREVFLARKPDKLLPYAVAVRPSIVTKDLTGDGFGFLPRVSVGGIFQDSHRSFQSPRLLKVVSAELVQPLGGSIWEPLIPGEPKD
jgi:hypothetical protein